MESKTARLRTGTSTSTGSDCVCLSVLDMEGQSAQAMCSHLEVQGTTTTDIIQVVNDLKSVKA